MENICDQIFRVNEREREQTRKKAVKIYVDLIR